MPRRKKRWWKPRIKTKSLQSIAALVLILLGILLVLTFFASLTGVENSFSQSATFVLGWASFLLPLNLILFGLSMTKIKHPIAEPRLAWGVLTLTVSLATLLGAFSEAGGGWVGTAITDWLVTLITRVGVVLVGLVGILIALIAILNQPLTEIFGYFRGLPELVGQIYAQTIFPLISEARNGNGKEETVETAPALAPTEATETASAVEIITDSPPTPPAPSVPSTAPSLTNDLEYVIPPLSLLSEKQTLATDEGNIEKNANTIERTLQNFGIQAKIVEVSVGPAVTQFAIELAEGTKTSKITSLQNEFALALASPTGSVRIEAPIPGKRLIGIEVPNSTLSLVNLRGMLESEPMHQKPSKLMVAIGEDVSGKPVAADIASWPHILIAGQTGSGKSVLLHSIIASILFRATPGEVSFIMVDPKRVELTNYNSIPHLQFPVIVDPDRTVNAFKWAVGEMEKRYRLFEQIGARSLDDFNRKTDTQHLPYIVIVVDELADLMTYAANEMETQITRIAQKARATGIFMILATQRPSVNVITGLIKANIPTRIALNVTSGTDSRVILDMIGAEKLLGRGDMLYLPPDGKLKRIQGVFLTDEEIQRLTDHLRQFPSPYSSGQSSSEAASQTINGQPSMAMPGELGDSSSGIDESDDRKFVEAVEIILNHDKASASLLQRRLKVGYARAARLLDELEEKGLVGEKDGSNPRDVMRESALEYLERLDPNR